MSKKAPKQPEIGRKVFKVVTVRFQGADRSYAADGPTHGMLRKWGFVNLKEDTSSKATFTAEPPTDNGAGFFLEIAGGITQQRPFVLVRVGNDKKRVETDSGSTMFIDDEPNAVGEYEITATSGGNHSEWTFKVKLVDDVEAASILPPPAPSLSDDGEVSDMIINNKNPKLVNCIVETVCGMLENTVPEQLKVGKADFHNFTFARRASVYLAWCVFEQDPSIIFPVFGMKNTGSLYSIRYSAKKDYLAGGEFKAFVDKVRDKVSAKFFEKSADADDSPLPE